MRRNRLHLVTIGTLLAAAVFTGCGAESAEAQVGPGEGTMGRGGPARNGWYVGPGPTGPDLEMKWWELGGRMIDNASPVGDNQGAIYGHGLFGAYEAATGRELWRWEDLDDQPRPPSYDSSPAFYDGRVYFAYSGEGLPGEEKPTYVYAFDAGSGRLEWEREVEGLNGRDIVAADGAIYLSQFKRRPGGLGGHKPGALLALDAESGETLWEREPDGAFGTPAVAEGMLFVIEEDSEAAPYTVHALDAASGERVWQRDEDFAWQIMVAGSAVYVLVERETGIMALDLHTGEQLWTKSTDLRVRYSTAATDETFFVVGATRGRREDEHIYALDSSDGSVRWRTAWRECAEKADVESRFGLEESSLDGLLSDGELMVSDGILYTQLVPRAGAAIMAVDAETGEFLWLSDLFLTGDEELESDTLNPEGVKGLSATIVDGLIVGHGNYHFDPLGVIAVIGDRE